MGIAHPRGHGRKRARPGLSELLSIDRKVLQDSPIGVIEVDARRHVRYANSEALDIIGLDSAEGIRLDLAFQDDDARALLDLQWKERRKGLIGAYRAHLRRRSDGRRVLVHITGVPLFGPAGKYSGAVAFVQRAGDDALAEEIHRLNGSREDTRELLHDVMARLLDAFDADMAVASRYSKDLAHAQSFFVLTRTRTGDHPEWRKRWIKLDAAQRVDVKTSQTRVVADLSKFMRGKPWDTLLEDPLVKAILKGGQKGALGRPIRRQNKLLGTITLLSKRAGLFELRDVRRIDELPLDATFVEYIDYQDRQLAAERFALLQALTRCKTLREACALLSRRLVRIFGWSHVSTYRVDHAGGRIQLLAQQGLNRKVRLPRNYSQPIGAGVLGRLVRTGKPMNIGNVADDKDYLSIIKGVSSELSWPIAWGGEGKIRLIINVEDQHENAFSENESAWLGVIAKEVGALMERIGQTHFLTECFRSASDPILYADAKHVIRHANPAALRLLSCKDEAQLRGPLKALFEDDSVFRQLSERADAEEVQCRLRTRNRAVPVISAHISRQPLADEVGGAIYVLRDLRDIQRAVEVDLLGQATYEVAMQTKAPLSLAMATLEQCAGGTRTPEARAAETALRHLDRVERGYTRLAMYRGNRERAPSSPATLDLGAELRSVAADLRAAPDAPSPVSIDQKVAPPPIRGDHSQVAFILETLLSGLVRSSPEDQPVTASFAVEGKRLLLDLKGRVATTTEGTEAVRLGADVRSSLWLARPMIDQFLETHGADLREQREGDRITYRLSFPAAEAARV